jgi:S1-C subfamily serine protease
LGGEGCVEVTEVVSDSPAERAGLRRADLIYELGGTRVTGVSDIQRAMLAELIGRTVEIKVWREDRPRTLSVVPRELG